MYNKTQYIYKLQDDLRVGFLVGMAGRGAGSFTCPIEKLGFIFKIKEIVLGDFIQIIAAILAGYSF